MNRADRKRLIAAIQAIGLPSGWTVRADYYGRLGPVPGRGVVVGPSTRLYNYPILVTDEWDYSPGTRVVLVAAEGEPGGVRCVDEAGEGQGRGWPERLAARVVRAVRALRRGR